LFSAAQWGQHVMLGRLRDEIATDLDASHPAVARRLRAMKDAGSKSQVAPPTDVLDLREPRVALSDVVLDVGTKLVVDGLLEEHRRREDLAAWSLAPRHKVLLFGPPGNGKTTLAEAFAYELRVPFLAIRYGGLMDSCLGGTGKNLDKAVAFAETAPSVLFIDEFDGIGMARDRVGDVGELRRVTNQLLMALDRLADHVLLVCATNADSLVDHALRRRFDTHVEIAAPSMELRLECANRELSPELCSGVDLRAQAKHVATTVTDNLDAVVKACREIRRARALRSVSAKTGTAVPLFPGEV
jgi:SpoVK/Ycf46/Vps4 family AAA+-type ATPase